VSEPEAGWESGSPGLPVNRGECGVLSYSGCSRQGLSELGGNKELCGAVGDEREGLVKTYLIQ